MPLRVRLVEVTDPRVDPVGRCAECDTVFWKKQEWLAREEKARRGWEEEARSREIAMRWDPWIAAWGQIGAEAALPRARSLFLELIDARCVQLEEARAKRLAEASSWVGLYPICRSCGHRMASRDHHCLP